MDPAELVCLGADVEGDVASAGELCDLVCAHTGDDATTLHDYLGSDHDLGAVAAELHSVSQRRRVDLGYGDTMCPQLADHAIALFDTSLVSDIDDIEVVDSGLDRTLQKPENASTRTVGDDCAILLDKTPSGLGDAVSRLGSALSE
jgi:hypothetical protein